ncbi:hypothetical protein JOQ06_019998 [Pogonophryne albipinna]|uniref:Uncharacterized protein n=1 Tax=Pogonophryne albipinna TaxID=1090488 RepID=A0AAD6BSK7_9TELE|nr:hypothetical protein JOQ06_019998 [Pogonophryne albipinna]
MSGIRNVKKCVACQDKIFVACKKCPKCEAQQPHKDRLVKERKRFAAEEKEWKERIKKNCNGGHVLDSSFKMLDRLAALGYFPLLLLGKKNKNGYTADVFSSIQMKLDDCLEEDIKSVYAKVLKLHFRRFQNQKGTIEDCGTDLETEFVVLDLCPVDGTDVVVEATDVVVEATDVVVEATDVVVEATDLVVEATDVVVEATDVVVRLLMWFVEATDVVVKATDVVVEATDLVVEATDVVEAKRGITDPMQRDRESKSYDGQKTKNVLMDPTALQEEDNEGEEEVWDAEICLTLDDTDSSDDEKQD